MNVKVHIDSQGRQVTAEVTDLPKDSAAMNYLAEMIERARQLWCDVAPAVHATGFAAGTYADTQTVDTL